MLLPSFKLGAITDILSLTLAYSIMNEFASCPRDILRDVPSFDKLLLSFITIKECKGERKGVPRVHVRKLDVSEREREREREGETGTQVPS